MDAREQRGLQIAAVSKVVRKGTDWLVPSQSQGGERYTVNLEEERCSCPDYLTRGTKCKHQWAAWFVYQRETAPDGTVTETTIKVTRTTYPQNWTAYNRAQTEEKTRFLSLLAALSKSVPQPMQSSGPGRPRLPLSDMVFASVCKVYSGFSSRRFISDLRDAEFDGLIASKPHFNSVSNYLANPALTPILKGLVTLSGLPLKAVETEFAADSSGFGTSRFVRWYNKKYGREIDNREWLKVHLMAGVRTHVVTAVDVSGWAANDTSFFKPLLETTANHFAVSEVYADKAYLSHKNL